jgi:hypothetical protein
MDLEVVEVKSAIKKRKTKASSKSKDKDVLVKKTKTQTSDPKVHLFCDDTS